MKLAERMGRLGTESAFDVLARARGLEAQGRDVVHLEIGEPDFDTPAHIVEAASAALRDGHTHYCPALGLPELRDAIAEYISRTRGIDVSRDQVCVSPGAKPIMAWTIQALCQEGDEVICPNPSYPIYESMANFVGATVVPLPILEERDFRFDPRDLQARLSPRTRLVVLNSPANPTGGFLDKTDFEAIADILRDHHCMVLSDEIYSRILYAGEHYSIACEPGMRERTILLDGFSKTYAMTGWRLGYGVFPRELVPHIDRLAVNSVSCTASFTQKAGVAALNGPQGPVEAMVAEFKARRDLIVEGLNSIPGISCRLPLGAFYVFPNVKQLGLSSKALADRLLEEAGVAVLAGSAFGDHGEGYLRLSYANSIPNIDKALERIAALASRLVA
ncbi:MAG TPA: pyridoxal phosphate-dependent aminotransferase [Chloroflexota bacterium]|nr:pyridoxal phosphate-dependent aminotransferase [Chloroflexota bacterium]